jgi:hypothetical protein
MKFCKMESKPLTTDASRCLPGKPFEHIVLIECSEVVGIPFKKTLTSFPPHFFQGPML